MKSTNKINDPFLYGTPILDLHGETYESAKVLTKIFIEDNIKVCEKKIAIIHGKGTYTVKKAVYEELKQNKNVINYKIDIFNDGMTIVNLK